jgi:hypothetical protein
MNAPTTFTMLDYALMAAQIGPVFLVQPGGKKPLNTGWQAQATTDPERIKELWTANPNANIGIHAVNLLIIDVDAKNGKDGFASLAALEAELPEGLEATLEVQTPSGGRHLYYSLPEGVEVSNGVNVLGAGLDLRTKGGYVLAVGSKTPEGEYTVVASEPIADADPLVIARCKAKPTTERPATNAPPIDTDQDLAEARAIEYLRSLPVVEEGGRNVALMLATRRIGDLGVTVDRAVAIMEEHFQCVPALDEEEIYTTVHSAYRKRQTPVGSQSPEGMGFEVVPEQPADETTAKPQTKPKFIPDICTADFLHETEFKPLMFTVQNLLPEGVFLLAASPKIGKSWLTLQIAVAVASGSKVLGHQAVQGEALALALDGDSKRRLKDRMAKLGSHDMPADVRKRLHFVTDWPRVNDGGAEALDQWLVEHPNCRYVVVDVLECIRPARDVKANPYGEDYAALGALKKIAAARRVTIVVVHHVRKQQADDVLQTVSGTQGLTGAADGIIVLSRPRGEEQGVMHIIARDLPQDLSYAVRFHEGRWTVLGPAAAVARTDLQNDILAALRASTDPMAVTEIASEVGRVKSTVSAALKVMLRDGLVKRGDDKRYSPVDPGFSSPDGAPFEADGKGAAAR